MDAQDGRVRRTSQRLDIRGCGTKTSGKHKKH
jgi:hypothetical protein